MKKLKVFCFDRAVETSFVEKEIIKSILTTEEVFGKSKVNASLKYSIKDNKVIVFVFNETGEHVFRVFRDRIDHAVGRARYSLQENK